MTNSLRFTDDLWKLVTRVHAQRKSEDVLKVAAECGIACLSGQEWHACKDGRGGGVANMDIHPIRTQSGAIIVEPPIDEGDRQFRPQVLVRLAEKSVTFIGWCLMFEMSSQAELVSGRWYREGDTLYGLKSLAASFGQTEKDRKWQQVDTPLFAEGWSP